MLEGGFFKDPRRTLNGIDSETLLRCAEERGLPLFALEPSPSEISSFRFSLCKDGSLETGGVGYECRPLVRGTAGD
jgi:hypothetical protein